MTERRRGTRRLDDAARFGVLDLLGSGVVVLDRTGRTQFINQAAGQLLGLSPRACAGLPFAAKFDAASPMGLLLAETAVQGFGTRRLDLTLQPAGQPALHVDLLVTAESPDGHVVLEFREIDQRARLEREQRMLDLAQGNRELTRNLAHEIKNPLGGIRGAAQLLESELPSRALREYTQVIIKEAGRLQTLVDRLLAPHRQPRIVADVNIHEVCERVRSVVLAEHPRELLIERDYDASLPEFRGDREQLIQALLNLVRNAAQAMGGRGRIVLRTRIARQVTIAKHRWRLALDLHVVDDGPGVPEEIRERIFFPLVSGRQGGSGLGLTLAQTFVQQHGGTIECDSRPGRTVFRILLPLP